MKTIKQIDKQIKKLQSEKNKIEEKQKRKEESDIPTIKIGNTLYQTKDNTFNKRLSDIKIPKGWRLWLPTEVWKFYEDDDLFKKLNLNNCWFYVKQVRRNTTDIARFYADSDRAILNCVRDPTDADPSLGVRFAKDLKVNKIKNKHKEVK